MLSTFNHAQLTLLTHHLLKFTYLATASLYTNPAMALLTISKHKSEPSMLKQKTKFSINFGSGCYKFNNEINIEEEKSEHTIIKKP